MKKILTFLGVVLIVIGACFFWVKMERDSIELDGEIGADPAEAREVFGKTATLSVGGVVFYPDGLRVSLSDVNDSRCPKDVKCIQAGDVKATFRLSGGSVEGVREAVLVVGADGGPAGRSIETVDGYTISLDSVTTATTRVGEASAEKSKATFVIDLAKEKDAGAPLEDVGNAALKKDLIYVTNISANDTVKSPLTVSGEARGTWYFEASFPVELLDENGVSLAKGTAQAQSDWMTEDFVPFTITLTFTAPASGTSGTLVLHKDNPSGDPAKEDALIIPVQF